MKVNDKNNYLAMFEELQQIIEEFECIDYPKLIDYKGLVEDFKCTLEVCQEEIDKDKNKTYSRTIEKNYESRYLPMEQYERARVMLRRLKSDKAKLDKFMLENEDKDKKDWIFVGITKDELIQIKKDYKFLTTLFDTDLKDYKLAYEEIFLNGLSLKEYSKIYLDGKKKTAENLCNKIYRMVAQELRISNFMFGYKVALPGFKTKRNTVLANMEEELVTNVILNYLDGDRPEGYFEGMLDAYKQLYEAQKHIDENGNYN